MLRSCNPFLPTISVFNVTLIEGLMYPFLFVYLLTIESSWNSLNMLFSEAFSYLSSNFSPSVDGCSLIWLIALLTISSYLFLLLKMSGNEVVPLSSLLLRIGLGDNVTGCIKFVYKGKYNLLSDLYDSIGFFPSIEVCPRRSECSSLTLNCYLLGLPDILPL